MKGRFQRGKIAGISPFFAFQDIITSAMAVLITIVMLLALNMGEPGHGEPGDSVPAQLAKQLSSLLDELSRSNVDLHVVQETSAAAKLNPAALKAEIQSLRDELAAIQRTSQANAKLLADNSGKDGPKIVLAELEKRQAENAALAVKLARLREDSARSDTEMKRAEALLKEKEARLLAEQAKKNELWLIPDRSKTSKEPVVAVVSADAVILQRFDNPEKSELRGGRLSAKLDEALKAYSKLDQYIVFYLKPSGVDNFDSLVDSAKNAGFEIGYDAVAEEIAINFGNSK